jgi:cytochrome c oxidase accessory protein FixG
MTAPAATSEQVVSLYKAQKTIHARAVTGWFARWRWVMVALTQLVYYGLPWITWGERQAVLFDLAARRFYIFGLVLYPQDFIYLTALLIISAYALFLFTAVAGRLWCGYACPQTVYSEIFVWVERFFEGNHQQRIKADEAPWSVQKLGRKAGKHLTWVALALWTGFTLVGYFTPIRTLGQSVLGAGLGPWETFWILFYGFATYGNAGFLREQVCKYMCPYARFQSAMFDKDTLIISYDTARGEPRGSRSRKADPGVLGLGSCIDCNLCVQVCPTGIDIRRGLQYECIGCAACADVCDEVMDKMGYARGLVRYATQNAMHEGWGPRQMWSRVLRPRVLVYTGILLAIIVAFAISLSLRTPFRVDVVRDRGSLARIVDEGRLENVYRLQLMNATEQPQRFHIRVSGIPGATVAGRTDVDLGPAEARWAPVAVQVPADAAAALKPGAHPIAFEVVMEGAGGVAGPAVAERSTFVIPR